MPETRKADAVKIPVAMAGGGDARSKNATVAAVARPLLGLPDGARVNVPIPIIGGIIFVRPELETTDATHAQTQGYPKGHRLEGQERYAWVDRGDGVMLGFLRPDDGDQIPTPPDPSVLESNMAEAAKAYPFLVGYAPEG